MTNNQVEGLSKQFDIIIDDSEKPYNTKHVTKKEKALNILNKIDMTTKEGQIFYDKWLGKVENGLQKFDEKMEQIDQSFQKIGGGVPDKNKKKKDPLGTDLKLDLGPEIKF